MLFSPRRNPVIPAATAAEVTAAAEVAATAATTAEVAAAATAEVAAAATAEVAAASPIAIEAGREVAKVGPVVFNLFGRNNLFDHRRRLHFHELRLFHTLSEFTWYVFLQLIAWFASLAAIHN